MANDAEENSLISEYKFQLSRVNPVLIPDDVAARKGNKAAWQILNGVSIAHVSIPPDKWRAPHYHTNVSELSVILNGTALAGMITPQNEVIEFELEQGDCVYFPLGWTHWLRNTSEVEVQAYFNYNNEQPQTVEVAHVLSHFNDDAKERILTGYRNFTETE